jgi:20S proteasome alpha/beta subunit
MTTIVGICTGKGKKAIVLASDLAGTQEEWKPTGADIAVREQTRIPSQKIYVSDDRNVAIGMSGVFDGRYALFLTEILKGRIDLKKVVDKRMFKQLLQLNLSRFDGKYWQPENQNNILFATRYEGKPRLFGAYPLGAVEEERFGTSVGSGAKYAVAYLRSLGILSPEYLSTEKAVVEARNALKEASKDIHTTGLDLVVVSEDEMFEFGDLIKRSVDETETRCIKRIRASLAQNGNSKTK